MSLVFLVRRLFSVWVPAASFIGVLCGDRSPAGCCGGFSLVYACHGPVRGSLLPSCWSRYPRTVSELPWEVGGRGDAGLSSVGAVHCEVSSVMSPLRVRAHSTLLLALSLALPQPWKFRQLALVSLRHCSHKATSAGPRAQIWYQDCWTLPGGCESAQTLAPPLSAHAYRTCSQAVICSHV